MMTARSSSRPSPQWAELGCRVHQGLVSTVAGVTIFTAVFFVAYFFVQAHPSRPPLVLPITALDRAIPIQPWVLGIYASLWIYAGAGPGLQPSMAERWRYTLWMAALCTIGLAIFYWCPTQVPTFAGAAPRSPTYHFLHRLDASSNACPSLHVAVATFTAVRVESVLRELRAPPALRLASALWLLLIAYSTLALKQHVVIDVLTGAALGSVMALASLMQRRTLHK